jgi:peroxiredoxin
LAPKLPTLNYSIADKKEVSLSDFAGKNLIIQFFPAAFTGVCTAQMCSSRDELAFYNNMNAAVVGVSVDMVFSLGVFKEQNGITFDLLSDFNKTLIADYDMVQVDFALGMKGVAKRGAVLIDKDGVIQYTETTENPGVQVNLKHLKLRLRN